MTLLVVIYEEARGEYNEDVHMVITAKSESNEDILEALKEAGLTWQLRDPFEYHIYVVKSEIKLECKCECCLNGIGMAIQ